MLGSAVVYLSFGVTLDEDIPPMLRPDASIVHSRIYPRYSLPLFRQAFFAGL